MKKIISLFMSILLILSFACSAITVQAAEAEQKTEIVPAAVNRISTSSAQTITINNKGYLVLDSIVNHNVKFTEPGKVSVVKSDGANIIKLDLKKSEIQRSAYFYPVDDKGAKLSEGSFEVKMKITAVDKMTTFTWYKEEYKDDETTKWSTNGGWVTSDGWYEVVKTVDLDNNTRTIKIDKINSDGSRKIIKNTSTNVPIGEIGALFALFKDKSGNDIYIKDLEINVYPKADAVLVDTANAEEMVISYWTAEGQVRLDDKINNNILFDTYKDTAVNSAAGNTVTLLSKTSWRYVQFKYPELTYRESFEARIKVKSDNELKNIACYINQNDSSKAEMASYIGSDGWREVVVTVTPSLGQWKIEIYKESKSGNFNELVYSKSADNDGDAAMKTGYVNLYYKGSSDQTGNLYVKDIKTKVKLATLPKSDISSIGGANSDFTVWAGTDTVNVALSEAILSLSKEYITIDNVVIGDATVSEDKKSVTITTTEALSPDTKYTLTIDPLAWGLTYKETADGGDTLADITALTKDFNTSEEIADGDAKADAQITSDADNKIIGTVKLYNNTGEKITYKVYLALYNSENELIGLTPADVEADSKGIASIKTDALSFAGASKAKLLVWDGMTPKAINIK